MGVEPMIFGMRTQRPRPLDERAKLSLDLPSLNEGADHVASILPYPGSLGKRSWV